MVDAKARREMIERLTCTPGIGHFLEVHEYPLGDFDDILAKCKAHFGDQLAGKTFAVRCKRAGNTRSPRWRWSVTSAAACAANAGCRDRPEAAGSRGADGNRPRPPVRHPSPASGPGRLSAGRAGTGAGADVRRLRLDRGGLPDDAPRDDQPLRVLQPRRARPRTGG